MDKRKVMTHDEAPENAMLLAKNKENGIVFQVMKATQTTGGIIFLVMPLDITFDLSLYRPLDEFEFIIAPDLRETFDMFAEVKNEPTRL